MTTRREALTRLGIGGAVVFGGTVPGIRAFAAPLPVRKEINTLNLNDPILQTLRDGVKILKARPAGGPNWTDLANIHGTSAGFNKCPHRNWYFLPWHRAYLLMYEQIIRTATGNMTFAMPYWDWTAHPTVPQAFTEQNHGGQPNPLYLAQRNNGLNIPTSISGPGVMNTIYNVDTVYEKFGTSRPSGQNSLSPSWITTGTGLQGTLEGTPHNNIHVMLGGYMPQGNSPMDPIFLMHHGNIDHIWWTWNCKGRTNTTDPLWQNMQFANTFYNPTGMGTWTTQPSKLQNPATLGYSYGICINRQLLSQVAVLANQRLLSIYKDGVTAAARANGFQALKLQGRPNGAALEAVAPAPRALLSATLKNGAPHAPTPGPDLTAEQKQGSQVIAIIHNLTPPNPEVQVQVYAAVGAIPNGGDEGHLARVIGFFGVGAMQGHAMGGGIAAQVDLTDALRTSTGGVPSADEIRVHLVARPIGKGASAADAAATVAHAEVDVVIV